MFSQKHFSRCDAYLAATASSTSHLSLENGTLGLLSGLGTVLQGLDLGSKLDIELLALGRTAELVGGALKAGADRRGCVGVDGSQHDAEAEAVCGRVETEVRERRLAYEKQLVRGAEWGKTNDERR